MKRNNARMLAIAVSTVSAFSLVHAATPVVKPSPSTPVQVMNDDATAVPVKILANVPQVPYQDTESGPTCSGGPVHTNCVYTFPAVPDSKRLVITNFSYSGLSDHDPYRLALDNGDASVFPTFTSSFRAFSGGDFWVINSNQQVLLYVDSGTQPKLTLSMVGSSVSVFSDGATISGYLVNCAAGPGCPAIVP